MVYEASFPNLGIYFQKLPRVAFTVFNIPIYFYGLLITAGVLAGLSYAVRESKKTSQDPDIYYDYLFCALPAAIVGARLYYVAFEWDFYKDYLPGILDIRQGGLAIYGGVLAVIAVALIYTKKKKLSFGVFADTAAPGLVLGQVIGRWGNFFNKEVFGTYTDSLMAMRYLASSVDSIPRQVADKMMVLDGISYIQVHPTFLYESLWNVGVFILLNIYKRHKKMNGEVFLLYLIGYGIGRTWIEGIRTDQLLFWGTGIAVSQVLSVVLVLAALIAMIYRRRRVS